MEIQIKYEICAHRDTHFDAMVDMNSDSYINHIWVMCARLVSDNCWWIISRTLSGDKKHTDIGPFDTPEIAVVYMKLMADPVNL